MTTRWVVPAGVAVTELGQRDARLKVAVDGPVDRRATYWDADDLRLARVGALLRHVRDEHGGRWQAGVPDAEGQSLHEFAGPANRPPPGAVGQVLAYLRTAELRPLRRVSVRHVNGRLSDDGGPLARLSDQEISVYAGRRLAERFRELVVEPLDDASTARVGEALEPLGFTPAGGTPGWLRLLGPEASRPADVEVPQLGGSDPRRPLFEVVSSALLTDLDRMLRHDAGTRLGEDAEELHQMRVATRRLRSTLRTFRPLLDREWADGLRARLRALASVLGAVRDLDVQLELLSTDVARLDDRDASALAPLFEHLRGRREQARDELLDVLSGAPYLELLDTLVEAAHRPAVAEPGREAGAALAPLLERAWRRLRKAVDAKADLHEIRIRAKRLRYVADSARPVFGKPARRLARRASEVQDVLGVYQDAIVTQQLLRTYIAAAKPSSDEAVALGMLLTYAGQREHAAVDQWPAAWRSLRRSKLRRFIRQ